MKFLIGMGNQNEFDPNVISSIFGTKVLKLTKVWKVLIQIGLFAEIEFGANEVHAFCKSNKLNTGVNTPVNRRALDGSANEPA